MGVISDSHTWDWDSVEAVATGLQVSVCSNTLIQITDMMWIQKKFKILLLVIRAPFTLHTGLIAMLRRFGE